MVLETLAAVGLAGNVIQFVDFSCKLFDTATSVYHSQAGSSKDSQNLEDITQQLQRICRDLHRAGQNDLRPVSTMDKLAKDCEAAAKDLLVALERVKAKNPQSKRSSLKAALATIWNERQISAMEKRLDSYRSQLILELQILYWDDHSYAQAKEHVGRAPKEDSDVKAMLTSLGLRNNDLEANMGEQIANLKADIRTSIASLRRDLQEQKNRATSRKGGAKTTDVDVPCLATKLIRSEYLGFDITARLALLETLPFEYMHFRHAKIREAHPATCEWIFSQKFQIWLRSPEPVYWISGKPGSGKSTLMKYLADHDDTPEYLHQWSGTSRLVIARYFFWINGTELQRSIEGLLRVLLYEILRQCPDLIEATCPDEWEHARMHITRTTQRYTNTWSQAALLKAFKRLSKLDPADVKFCIFIDGLDEYSGEHEDLIETISYLTQINVKLCVASRPWNVFEEAFGRNSNYKVYMQDLNKPDIVVYVRDKLQKRPEFKDLQANNIKVHEIVEEIVDKSQGVFLWVFLVVRSLVEGLRNRDRLSQLQQRLQAFPGDLEDFFRHIFLSLDRNYRTQTAHLFKVALATDKPLSPLTYWFLDEGDDDENMALSMAVEPSTMKELNARMLTVKVRINGRCKGLLELTKISPERYYNYRVDFLHRTVKDFFTTSEMSNTFSNWQRSDFNPDLAICKASLAVLKVIALMPAGDAPPIYPPMESFLFSAEKCENDAGPSIIPYVDAFEKTIAEHVRMRPDESSHYPWFMFSCDNFLSVALSYNLKAYVKRQFIQDPPTRQQKEELLGSASRNAKPIRLDMMRHILPIGPPVELDAAMQRALWKPLSYLERSDIIKVLDEICSYASFDHQVLHDSHLHVLQEKFSEQEVENILNMIHNAKRQQLRRRTRYMADHRVRNLRHVFRLPWHRGNNAGT